MFPEDWGLVILEETFEDRIQFFEMLFFFAYEGQGHNAVIQGYFHLD